MTKTYVITEQNTWWALHVEIDHDVADPVIKEMVNFWSGAEERLARNDGDYTKAFLQMLAASVFRAVVSTGRFMDDHFNDLEGWVPMDGSKGIKIVAVDESPIDEPDFEVEEG